MEAWMKYATPGETHKKMAPWRAPDGESDAVDGAGYASRRDERNGGFQDDARRPVSHANDSATMMGQPFNGFGHRLRQREEVDPDHGSRWGTGMLVMTGTFGTDGTLTETGSMDDFATGKPMSFRGVMHGRQRPHDLRDVGTGPDGKMFKSVDYTRK